MNIGFFDGVAFFFDHDEKSGLYKQGEIIDGDDTFLSEDLEDATEFICTTEHAIACVNALQGIPTESLGEVKKAWLAWKIWEKFGAYCCLEDDIQDVPCLQTLDDGSDYTRVNQKEVNAEDVIATALIMRDGGADFGELNALIDSVKEG